MIQEIIKEEPKSAAVMFADVQGKSEKKMAQPSDEERILMEAYSLGLKEVQGVLQKADYLKALSGYVEFDLEQIESWDLDKMQNDQLEASFQMISKLMKQIHYANNDVEQTHTGWHNPFDVFFSDPKEPDGDNDHHKEERAVLSILKDQAAIFEESFQREQYLEISIGRNSERDNFSQIKPEVFGKLLETRSKLLNIAVQRMLPRTKGMDESDIVNAVLDQHFSDASFKNEVVLAILLVRKLENAAEMPIIAVDSSKRFSSNSVEPLNELEKMILMGGRTIPSTTSANNFLSYGRQWLEVGGGHTYKEIAKQAMVLYLGLGEFQTNGYGKKSEEKKDSWFDEEIQKQLQTSGLEGFLNRNIEDFYLVESPFRDAIIKLFQSFVDSAAKRKMIESKTYYGKDGDVHQQKMRDIETYIANMLKPSENSPSPQQVFDEMKEKYPSLRKARKLSFSDKWFAGSNQIQIDYQQTLLGIQNLDFHSIFTREIIEALIIDYLEPKFQSAQQTS